MQFQQFSANNRNIFIELDQRVPQTHESGVETTVQHSYQSVFYNLPFKKHSCATSTIASSDHTPVKNCGYSTNQQEDYQSDELNQTCDGYYTFGACMKGTDCEFEHECIPTSHGKKLMKSLMMQKFPEMIVMQHSRRVKSFLL